MPRRPPVTTLLLGVGALLLALLAGVLVLLVLNRPGSSGVPSTPVAVEAPGTVDAATASACARLLAALPDALDEATGSPAPRRTVTDPALTAAWGEPAVTLACGVAAPLRLEPPFEVSPDDGPFEGFTVRDVGSATRFTTSGRLPRVAVEVPDDVYDSQVLQDLVPGLRLLPTAPPAP